MLALAVQQEVCSVMMQISARAISEPPVLTVRSSTCLCKIQHLHQMRTFTGI